MSKSYEQARLEAIHYVLGTLSVVTPSSILREAIDLKTALITQEAEENE